MIGHRPTILDDRSPAAAGLPRDCQRAQRPAAGATKYCWSTKTQVTIIGAKLSSDDETLYLKRSR